MSKEPAKKKKAVRKPAPNSVFNLLVGDSILDATAESLHALRARRKNDPTTVRSLHQIKRNGIPIEHFYLQFLLGMAYLPSRCVIELIGSEGIGKTTFLFHLLGMAGRANVPSLYQESEGKPMMEDQIRRCLSSNAELAEQLFSRAVSFADVREIRQSAKLMDEWVFDLRGRGTNNKEARLPDENPVAVAIDTWSKLMSPGQAAGYMDHGDFMKADQMKNLKEVGEGSNLEHSKHAAWWCRRLPYLLHDHNVVLFLNSHQNAKIEMGGTSYMSGESGRMYNKTKIGGKAFDQNAALQIIMGAGGQAKNGSGQVTGKMIRMRVDKNSFGPDGRQIEYELRNVYTQDSDTFLEPAVQFDEAMAKWFADTRMLNTVAEKKRYTCEALSVIGGSAEDLSKALHANLPTMTRLAKDLAIRGYNEIIEAPEAPLAGVEIPPLQT